MIIKDNNRTTRRITIKWIKAKIANRDVDEADAAVIQVDQVISWSPVTSIPTECLRITTACITVTVDVGIEAVVSRGQPSKLDQLVFLSF